MEGLQGLVSLRKLYLEKNYISRLEGLEQCTALEELSLGDQQTETEFTLDEYSLVAISSSLRVLDLHLSNIRHTKALYYLEYLETLNLSRNMVEDFETEIYPFLQTITGLNCLDLSFNPVILTPKYRDKVVLFTRRLSELDGKKITN